MREIKFRAWDKENKRWYDFESGDLDYSGDNPTIAFFDLLENFEVQQFTGLKDKNGKDIYEGDIVKRKDFDGWENKETVTILEIIWEECGFAFKTISSDWIYGYEKGEIITVHPFKKEEFEVIGNKFENPELLK